MSMSTGLGELYADGKPVASGRYRVEVTEPMAMKLGHIEGTIALDLPVAFELVESGAKLTLHLEDGRRWDCFLQSSNGRLVNRGEGLYKP